MTTEQQLEQFGLAAVAIDGKVMILDGPPGQADNVRAQLEPRQAQRFCSHFVAAYVQAAGGVRRRGGSGAGSGTLVLEGTR